MPKQNLVSASFPLRERVHRKTNPRHVLTSSGPQVEVYKGRIRDLAKKWIRKAGHNGTIYIYINMRNIILGLLVINADQQLVNDVFSQFACRISQMQSCKKAKLISPHAKESVNF